MRPALQALLFRSGGAPFTYPTDLGASLLGLWDAENPATFGLSGSAVDSWADLIGGYTLSQSSASLKPIWNATSFNGRPGVTFDGSDDVLKLASTPLPTGATPCEIHILCDQTMLATNTQAGVIVGWGNETVNGRDVRRRVVSGVNRATTAVGNGSVLVQVSNTNVDFSGRHIIRSVISGNDATTYATGDSSGATAVTPTTGTARTHMGSVESSGFGNYWGGVLNMVAVTGILTAAQAADLYAFMLARKG